MKEDWHPSALCSNMNSSSYECNLIIFNQYIAPYIKYTKIEDRDNRLYVYFTDSSAARFTYYGQDIWFFPKSTKTLMPFDSLKIGKDYFGFAFYPAGASGNRNSYFKGKGVEPYITVDWDGTKKGLYSSCNNAAKIIQLNGWLIPDDYPCLH